jgi:beta-glucosidase
MDKNYIFPSGFLWGSATSAWQVEGGRILNEYEQLYRDGKMAAGDDPAQSAGFWMKYPEDIALMKQMGHKSFRMSVEWARIEPEEGQFDDQAIQHYRQIIQAVREAGIQPVVDLLHHSSPLWLYRYGGWTSQKAVGYLQRFAERVVNQLGDLVEVWMTINEPTVWAAEAYLDGVLPPYFHSLPSFFAALKVFAHGHRVLYEAIKEIYLSKGWQSPSVGFAHAVQGIDPFRENSLPDRSAARLVRHVMLDRFLDLILRKDPTLDFLGVNYYTCLLVRFPMDIRLRNDLPVSKEGWPIDPHGFYRILQAVGKMVSLPIWVMENGIGEDDDSLRPRFLLDHLYQLHRAIQAGVDVRAYHHWSTLDTLEYHKGYNIKYGLIKVDLASPEKRRCLRNSGRMYGEIAAANGITSEIVGKYLPDWSPDSFPQGYSREYSQPASGKLF